VATVIHSKEKVIMKSSALLILTAVIVAFGTPAFAKKLDHHSMAKSASQAYAKAPMSREDAIRACNETAAKWRYSDWQTAQISNYRDCMTEHGQQFE
jgi:Tfp pilus assembly protein FimT